MVLQVRASRLSLSLAAPSAALVTEKPRAPRLGGDAACRPAVQLGGRAWIRANEARMSVANTVHHSGKALIYSDIRSQIRTGDILLFQGQSPLSRVIRWGS